MHMLGTDCMCLGNTENSYLNDFCLTIKCFFQKQPEHYSGFSVNAQILLNNTEITVSLKLLRQF